MSINISVLAEGLAVAVTDESNSNAPTLVENPIAPRVTANPSLTMKFARQNDAYAAVKPIMARTMRAASACRVQFIFLPETAKFGPF